MIQDRYLLNTRLRLRIMTDLPEERRVFKLNRKAESDSPYFRSMTRILLGCDDYDTLAQVPANELTKRRHYHDYDGRVATIDVFGGPLDGLILCEVEASSLEELMSIPKPPYASREVTEDPFFQGGNLCRATASQLRSKLGPLGWTAA